MPTIPSFRDSERGGITILVVLMLLVLLTVASVAMSKNAIREVIIAGTARQGAEARSVADSGLEWSILWLDDADPGGSRPAPDAAAISLRDMAATISDDTSLAGFTQKPSVDLVTTSVTPELTKQYRLELMYMGPVDPEATSPDIGTSPGQLRATSLAGWSVLSEGQLVYANGPTFIHRREVWFTALPKGTMATRP